MGPHRHRVDPDWSGWAVENDEFEQVCAAVGAEDEVTGRIFTYLLDDDRVLKGVVDVVRVNAVLER